MKNKKEITMWAIWSQSSKSIIYSTVSRYRNKSLALLEDQIRNVVDKVAFKKRFGYRAVKGKFVWEER